MKQLLAFIFLPFLLFSLEPLTYFQLDNETPADEFALATDPFLILRTKASSIEETFSFEDSVLSLFDQPTIKKSRDFQEDERFFTSCSFKKETSFSINTNLPKAQKVWWQISLDPSFQTVISNLDQVEPFSGKITLDIVAETFLSPNQTYYFRAKTIFGNYCSHWSESLSFCVHKPDQAKHINFNKLGFRNYEITWEKDPSPSAEYLIFASNSQDFIPSIYYDKQIISVSPEKEIQVGPNYSFVALSSSNRIEVDGTMPYYRIVVTDQNKLSIPSELIYVYDTGLQQQRDFLKINENFGVVRTQTNNPYITFKSAFQNFVTHPYVSQTTWDSLEPYLLPDNHPIRPALDKMFSKNRLSESLAHLRAAGFKTKGGPEKHNKTIFCQHKKLKGYVAKIIPDECYVDEIPGLLSRISGALTVQQLIDKHNYHNLIKVPRKWLYPLPLEPSPPKEMHRKNFILIAEDMDIYPREINNPMWKSVFMNFELLHAIYTVLSEGGFCDVVYAFNIPFSKDGKIAFIDTEDHQKWPIPYFRLRKYLSKEMQQYWDILTLPEK